MFALHTQAPRLARKMRSPERRSAKFLVAAGAVAAMLTAGCMPGASGDVPPQLVGTWSGGYNDGLSWRLQMEADGTYELTLPDDPSLNDSGVVAVTSEAFWLRSDNPDSEVAQAMTFERCDWEFTEMELYGHKMQTISLCGQTISYVREMA